MPKICPRCGTSCGDGQAFCPRCGSKLPEAQQQPYGQRPPQGRQPYGVQRPPHSQGYQPQQPPPYGQRPQQPPPYGGQQPPYGQQPYGPGLGMKWFKFNIFFYLFVAAIGYLGRGISAMAGKLMYYVFDDYFGFFDLTEAFHEYYSSLKVLDILFGLCLIALAAGAIYVRMQLAGFRANGPKLYLGLWIAATAVQALHDIAVLAIVTKYDAQYLVSPSIATIIGQLIGMGVFIALNNIYFNKRAHMFTN